MQHMSLTAFNAIWHCAKLTVYQTIIVPTNQNKSQLKETVRILMFVIWHFFKVVGLETEIPSGIFQSISKITTKPLKNNNSKKTHRILFSFTNRQALTLLLFILALNYYSTMQWNSCAGGCPVMNVQVITL